MKKLLLAVLLPILAAASNAAIVTGDFVNESDLPYCCARSGPKVLTSLGQSVGAGLELSGSSTLSNPSGWGGGIVYVDLNPTNNILTLLSQDTWDFETFLAKISNITFDTAEVITGITMLTNGLTDPSVLPVATFTDNSIMISYDNGDIFDFTGGTATFQITTGQSVPEPESIALFGLALAGLGLTRRKAKQA